MDKARVYMERHRPEKREARYYAMSIARSLFGDWTLLREWGRIGSAGRGKMDWFDSEDQAAAAMAKLEKQKTARGYRARS